MRCIITLVAFASLAALVPSAQGDLISYWALDETSGPIVDAVGGNNGTLVGTPTLGAAGIRGTGVNFAGGSQRIDMGTTSSLEFGFGDSFSLSVWVNSTATSGAPLARMNTSASYRGYDLYFDASVGSSHMIDTWSSNAFKRSNPTDVNNGVWHHLAMTYDGSGTINGLTVYVDGQATSQTIDNNTFTSGTMGTTNFLLGGRTGGNPFAGLLDEASVWNEALSAGELAALYAANTDSGNLLNSLGLDVAEISQLFDVHEAQSGSALVGGYNWQYLSGVDTTGFALGDTFATDGGQFLFLDAGANSGVLATVPLTPEPASMLLFAMTLLGGGGWYIRRRANGTHAS